MDWERVQWTENYLLEWVIGNGLEEKIRGRPCVVGQKLNQGKRGKGPIEKQNKCALPKWTKREGKRNFLQHLTRCGGRQGESRSGEGGP